MFFLTKQKILFFSSGLIILLIGFFGATYFNNKSFSQINNQINNHPAANSSAPLQSASDVALVPPYVPEQKTAPVINPGLNSVSATPATETVTDEKTGEATKLIDIVMNDKITPSKIYLNKNDNVKLNFINQQSQDALLVSLNKTRLDNIKIASGAEKAVSYDTTLSGDSTLVCQTCTPPTPLFIRVLVGRAPKTSPSSPSEPLK